jgi:hypothetical protein
VDHKGAVRGPPRVHLAQELLCDGHERVRQEVEHQLLAWPDKRARGAAGLSQKATRCHARLLTSSVCYCHPSGYGIPDQMDIGAKLKSVSAGRGAGEHSAALAEGGAPPATRSRQLKPARELRMMPWCPDAVSSSGSSGPTHEAGSSRRIRGGKLAHSRARHAASSPGSSSPYLMTCGGVGAWRRSEQSSRRARTGRGLRTTWPPMCMRAALYMDTRCARALVVIWYIGFQTPWSDAMDLKCHIVASCPS